MDGGICVAKIALSAATFAIDKPYDYRVPWALVDTIQVGMRVIVPFGAGNRRTEGIVLAITPSVESMKRVKNILTLLDEEPVLDENGLKLALWMRGRYFCTVYDAAHAMLPAGLWFFLRDTYAIASGVTETQALECAGNSGNARQIVELLAATPKPMELEKIKTALGAKNPMPALKMLVEKAVVVHQADTKRQINDKTERIVSLAISAEEAMALVTPKRSAAPKRYDVVEFLCTVGSASYKEICYFTGASSSALQWLELNGILSIIEQKITDDPLPFPVGTPPALTLTEEQETAFEGLRTCYQQGKASAALLYGVTGSGKTQVYIRLIQSVIADGKTAIVLVPEIALTPQLQQKFTLFFGNQVAILHSSLKARERYRQWKRIHSGQATVVIGTRSAVFAPVKNLGLLILDEEQEGTYKSEQVPRYHARDIAKFRCAQQNALLLLGSATPSIESMYAAQKGTYHLFTLTQRYNAQTLPKVEIVDMKRELRQGNGTSISTALQSAIGETIARGEQCILFLNRRGTNRLVSCGDCGAVPQCVNCSVSLTYHSANHRLMCHHCGYSQPLPKACPTCGGELNFIGLGIQKVEEDLTDLFPGISVLRMDMDTITASNSYEAMFRRFQNEKIPILLGTQMVAKGLDFENVTLVGVIAADFSLYIDHFRAAERTFSMLTQVVGRAGRGTKEGRALIQTWTPEHEVIQGAAVQDYMGFYQNEIGYRKAIQAPPFSELFLITASGIHEDQVRQACFRVRQGLEQALKHPDYQKIHVYHLLGPVPAFIAKVNNRFRYQLTLSCANTGEIRNLIAHMVRTAQSDKANRGVSVFADLNPPD